eukprot:s1398_g1.t1
MPANVLDHSGKKPKTQNPKPPLPPAFDTKRLVGSVHTSPPRLRTRAKLVHPGPTTVPPREGRPSAGSPPPHDQEAWERKVLPGGGELADFDGMAARPSARVAAAIG